MPQRFLRPGITNSDAWNAVSFEAQSLYIRIITLVDDFGRYDARVPILHGQCFALRPDIKPQRTAVLRQELHDFGLIIVYSVDGKDFLQVTKWQERARVPVSKFPEPPVETTNREQLPDNPQESAAVRSGSQRIPASIASISVHHISSPSPAVESAASGNGAKESPPTDEEWIVSLVQDRTYEGIDVQREFGKMQRWCELNRKSPTRKRFINWLNRADRPMSPHKHGTLPAKDMPKIERYA